MSRPALPLPDGWQIARRAGGHFLQRRAPDGRWQDVAGPYKQRGHAYQRWERDSEKQTGAEAMATTFDEWTDPGDPIDDDEPTADELEEWTGADGE